MFDKLNAMKQQMEDLKLRMDQLQVNAEAHHGAIRVTANGNGLQLQEVGDFEALNCLPPQPRRAYEFH